MDKSELDKLHLVFVYGTLKSGGVRGLDTWNNEFLDSDYRFKEDPQTGLESPIQMHLEIKGKAVTKNNDFEMIDLGSYPALISGEKYIQGEVWEVDGELLHFHLDPIEGYPNLYNRTKTETSLGLAWVYYMPQQVKNFVPDSKNIKEVNNIQSYLI